MIIENFVAFLKYQVLSFRAASSFNCLSLSKEQMDFILAYENSDAQIEKKLKRYAASVYSGTVDKIMSTRKEGFMYTSFDTHHSHANSFGLGAAFIINSDLKQKVIQAVIDYFAQKGYTVTLRSDNEDKGYFGGRYFSFNISW